MKRMSVSIYKPIENSIRKKLNEALKPVHMEIINESHMHNVPHGSETHFKIIVISDKFQDQPTIQCHRIVYNLIECELRSTIHALSILTKTPKEWEASGKEECKSPPCRGGFGK